MTALRRRLRLRGEEGFTLVELLIAMIVLTVGILALVAAYTSAYTSMNRATKVSSATLIADSQMERFRALKYGNIKLNRLCGSNCAEDASYTSNPVYNATAEVTAALVTDCPATDATCRPTQTRTGPDGRLYRLDTFIKYSCVPPTSSSPALTLTMPPSLACTYTTDGKPGPDPVKLVTVVVTKTGSGGGGAGGTITVREQSSFTSITGG